MTTKSKIPPVPTTTLQVTPTPLLTALLDSVIAEPTEPIHRLALADYYQDQQGLTPSQTDLVDVLRLEGYFMLQSEPNFKMVTMPIGDVPVWDGVKQWHLLYRTRKQSGVKVVTIGIVSVDNENRKRLPYCGGIDPKDPTMSTVNRTHHQGREIHAKPGPFPNWYCHHCYALLCDHRARAIKKARIAEEDRRKRERRQRYQ